MSLASPDTGLIRLPNDSFRCKENALGWSANLDSMI